MIRKQHYLTRQGTSGESYGAMANFKLSRYENSGGDSRTRLDINLAHGDFDDINVLTALSSGNIGINTTNPQDKLHIYNGYIRLEGTDGHRLNINDDEILKYNNTPLTIGTVHGQSLYFKIVNSTRMTIDGTGNVGINTTEPQEKLHTQRLYKNVPK